MIEPDALPVRDGTLTALNRSELLDFGEDTIVAQMARVARSIYGAPMAAVSILDGAQEVLWAGVGVNHGDIARTEGFWQHMRGATDPLCIPDCQADPRVRKHPLVAGPDGVRACLGVPLTIATGQHPGAICVLDHVVRPDFSEDRVAPLADLAELMSQVIEVRTMSRTDALTGLTNRRHFLVTLDREVKRANRYNRPLSLVFIDLDHFKQVNDAHGHGIGDEVLQACGARVLSGLRDTDIPGRLGGEEFGVILPETSHAGVVTVARRLSELIGGRTFETGAGPLSLTASIGAATATGRGRTAADMMAFADDAQYRAKAAGRNCIHFAGEDTDGCWREAV